MFIDYLENIVQLVTILIALMISVSGYISGKNRTWLCAVAYYIGNMLSCYFWTSYLIIMGEQPETSDFFTNFGWNVSYFLLLLLVLQEKPLKDRKYFHLLMLLPIPLNIWQLTLYFEFGGILNSIYEVTVCTIAACLTIQDFLLYRRDRKNGAKFPYIALAVFIGICTEFGMWTCSCYGDWIGDMYYVFSFLCSAYYLLLVWTIGKTYAAEKIKTDSKTRNMQRILKGAYMAIAVLSAIGGIALGYWIKNVLTGSLPEDVDTTGLYDIIQIVLFLTSVMLSFFAVLTILIVYFQQRISENNSLREARMVAERSNAAKSDFLANMSHEIRTPINAVLGMNRMIMDESLKARDSLPHDRNVIRQAFSDITGYSANIDSAGNSLLSIINDILDFSKIEAGKLDITEREYMLSSVLNDVSNTVMFRAKDKGLKYFVDADENIPDKLYGDEMRIRQVIVNIVNNAVKYTDSGSVRLSVSGSGQSYAAGGRVELIIAVKDTGIGIRKEDIDKIFGKFERTDLKHNSTVEGTGLGLAITRRLLDMMGGSINVESDYGKGSLFTVRIPQKIVSPEPIGSFREKFEQRMSEAHVSDSLFRAPDAHILIVDDTRMNLTVAVGLIKDTEIKADTAESGAKAIEVALENNYDLILMDQRMPVMDGTETLRRLREQIPADRKLPPVICLTADAISGAKERYLKQGFDDYLSKPIDSDELKKMLMKYLPGDKVLSADGGDIHPHGNAAHEEEEEDGFEALRAVGIDTSVGLDFCQGDGDFYRMVLAEYVSTAAEKTKKLRQFRTEADWKNYATLVHALKSTSRTIGANEVADLAAELEKAAASEDAQTVNKDHDAMIEKFRSVVAVIRSVTN